MAERVHITSRGTGFGSVITAGDTQIHGVVSANIRIGVYEPNRCDLELLSVGLDTDALATYYVADPVTGVAKAVRRIEFADGTEWTVAAAEPEVR